jgi:hypothetical protein
MLVTRETTTIFWNGVDLPCRGFSNDGWRL